MGMPKLIQFFFAKSAMSIILPRLRNIDFQNTSAEDVESQFQIALRARTYYRYLTSQWPSTWDEEKYREAVAEEFMVAGSEIVVEKSVASHVSKALLDRANLLAEHHSLAKRIFVEKGNQVDLKIVRMR